VTELLSHLLSPPRHYAILLSSPHFKTKKSAVEGVPLIVSSILTLYFIASLYTAFTDLRLNTPVDYTYYSLVHFICIEAN